MDYSALKSEIDNDPENIGYSGKSNSQITELLNGNGYTKIVPVSVSNLMIWAASRGVMGKIHDGSDVTNVNAQLRSICIVAEKMIEKTESESLDITNPTVVGMLDALVAGSIISSDDKDALMAFGTVSASRAENLFNKSVTLDDVRTALA